MLHRVLVPLCLVAAYAQPGKTPASRSDYPTLATSLLAVKATLRKSHGNLADDSLAEPSATPSYLGGQHASAAQQWLQAREEAVTLLADVTQRVGSTSLGSLHLETHNNSVDHANKSSNYKDELVSVENSTHCQECAVAEVDLIEALRAAREAHMLAQEVSVALNHAVKDHTDHASQHQVHLDEFAQKLQQLQVSMAAKSSFDVVAALAQGMYPAAQRAQESESAVEAQQSSMASAQEEYNRVAAEAVQSDSIVYQKQEAEREACGVPTTSAPTMAGTTHLKGTFVFGLDPLFPSLGEVLFYDSDGAIIEASLVNYQDELWHPGRFGACGLNNGQLTSGVYWHAGAYQAPLIEPATPDMLKCTGVVWADGRRGYNHVTPQGATEKCACEGGQYKGNHCPPGGETNHHLQSCHWFIWELQRKVPVAHVEVWVGPRTERRSSLSFAEFSACVSDDVTTCSNDVMGSSSLESHADKMDVFFTR